MTQPLEARQYNVPILQVVNVSHTYTTVQGKRVNAIQNISIYFLEQEFHSIVGPSGCGKSTLLMLLSGLQSPTQGEIMLDGQPLRGPRPDKIGMVFQQSTLFPWLTLIRNVAFPLELKGVPRKEREERARHYINLVGLAGFEHSLPHELSGGMQQRACIARALVADPDILLMDEPFGALDEQTRQILGEELLRIWEQTQKTIVFVTHSLHEAVFLSDRVTVIGGRPGRVVDSLIIDLPRPRQDEITTSPKFQELRNRIWRSIRYEATDIQQVVGP